MSFSFEQEKDSKLLFLDVEVQDNKENLWQLFMRKVVCTPILIVLS